MAGHIVPTPGAEMFFWSLLQGQGVGLTDAACIYVVHVLVKFSRSDEVFAGVGRGERAVLVDFLQRAQSVETTERERIYRHVGDVALFTAGFFSSSLFMGRQYYVAVGEGAYGSAASLTRAPSSAVVLEELSDRFGDVTDALANSATV